MFEFISDQYTKEQCERYLERIGYEKEITLDRETLNGLVYAHQCHVPFENLDLYPAEHPIYLDQEQLYQKIVLRKRGGFCFELNGAFQALLKGLGFDAYSCMCRVAVRREGLGNLSHRGTIIRLNGKKYVADVGLGGPMAPFAVEISPKLQTFFGETYWVEEISENWYLMRRKKEDGTDGNVIVFSTQPFLSKDFQPLCQELLRNPECSFKQRRMVNLRTLSGSLKLENDCLTVHENGEKKRTLP